jgi:hypothetical protein
VGVVALLAAAFHGRTLGEGTALDRHVAAEQTARKHLGPDRYDIAVREGMALTPETPSPTPSTSSTGS